MYVDILRILLVVWAIVLLAIEAQDTQCSAQRCYQTCVEESDACTALCRQDASRIRNRRKAGAFLRRCQGRCNTEIGNCFFKDCGSQCPPKVEGTYESCSSDCVQNALAGVDRCFERTGAVDFCLPANNENLRICDESCRKLYPTEPSTQAPATATTAPAATANPTPPPTDAEDDFRVGCGTIDRYLEVHDVCTAPCFFNLCLNSEKCSGVSEDAANRQCTSDGIKAYESCIIACQS